MPRFAKGTAGLLAAALIALTVLGVGPRSPDDFTKPPTDLMTDQETPSRLAVLWTSGDREVALKVTFMYTLNAKARGWFDEVTLIVWGPSSDLLANDSELQDQVTAMGEAGVELVACKACADSYGVSGDLEALGIEVKYMGVPLTEMLKGDWEVLTF
jgi:hypothetical protein